MSNATVLALPPARRIGSHWRRAFTASTATLVGLSVVLLIALFALLGPSLMAYGPSAIHPSEQLQGPSAAHLLGTDQFGRDILSRLASGGRISLLVGIGSTFISLTIGVFLGSVAAYVGGWLDEIIMRVIDVLMAFPYIVLAIALAWTIGPGLWSLIGVIGIIGVPQAARIARGAVLAVRDFEFVEAARALGQTPGAILIRHVLPNALSPIVVFATIAVATAINAEAALSFLGLGIQPPTASWGTMLADGRDYLFDAPWIATFPGIIISLSILGLNLLGDGLRDALDPTMRGRLD